jgi:hypothetical protein
MTEGIEDVLGWWLLGCISSADVVRWADRLIEDADSGDQLPEWLMAVSLMGPRKFLRRARPDDPRPKDFSFIEAFRAKVEATDPMNDAAVGRFSVWIARNAMGEELSVDEVRAGHEIDDLLECDVAGAHTRAKELLVTYGPSCRNIREALPWWRAAERVDAADEA